MRPCWDRRGGGGGLVTHTNPADGAGESSCSRAAVSRTLSLSLVLKLRLYRRLFTRRRVSPPPVEGPWEGVKRAGDITVISRCFCSVAVRPAAPDWAGNRKWPSSLGSRCAPTLTLGTDPVLLPGR